MKILVTDGSYKHTLGILISLRELGNHVDFIGNKKSICNSAPGLGYMAMDEKSFSVENSFKLISLIREMSYDLVIPVGAASVEIMAQVKESLPDTCRCELTSLSNIQLCLDSRETLLHASSIGIPVPNTHYITSADDILSLDSDIFPVVIKSNSEIEKWGPIYCDDKNTAYQSLLKYDFQTPLLVQERVVGNGYGFFALYSKGKLVNYYCHERVRERPTSGGVSVCAKTIYCDELLNLGKALLDSLSWHGVAMVEFKKEKKSGRYKLMEINPKFWGSHDLGLASGVNFPLELLDLHRPNVIRRRYKENVVFHWPLHGDIQTMFSGFKRFFDTFLDMLSPRVKSNIHWKMPRVLFWQLSEFIFGLLLQINLVQSLRRFAWRYRSIGLKNTLVRWITERTGIPILSYSEVEPGLAVGMQHSSFGLRLLSRSSYSACLSLRKFSSDVDLGIDFPYQLQIPVPEYHEPTIAQLQQGVMFIKNMRRSKRSVYIHCREGVSRAPLFVAAYLIEEYGLTVGEAIEKIKKIRPFINILPCQAVLLNTFNNTE